MKNFKQFKEEYLVESGHHLLVSHDGKYYATKTKEGRVGGLVDSPAQAHTFSKSEAAAARKHFSGSMATKYGEDPYKLRAKELKLK